MARDRPRAVLHVRLSALPPARACCDSLIMSPRRLIRNVPLSLRPPRRSWIGTDSDEHEGAEARGRVGTCGRRDVALGFGGGVDGRELSPSEAVVSAVPAGRGRGPETSERWARVESGDRGNDSGAGARARPGEIRRRGRRALWADAGGRTSGE